MQASEGSGKNGAQFETFERNRYFYGQLLDVEHFNCEQLYGMGKRRLLNRFVSGYGVVCGLDVMICRDGRSIFVTPGFALDQCGHEILVPCPSRPVELWHANDKSDDEREPRKPPRPHSENECHDEGEYVHVCLCYLECESDPTPILAADCNNEEYCVSAKTQERYRIVLKPGKAPHIDLDCSVPDLISGGRINYPALAIWVSQSCPAPCDDPCIPLANVRLPTSSEACDSGDVDITIRPICYTNDLLWELIAGLTKESQPHARGGKF